MPRLGRPPIAVGQPGRPAILDLRPRPPHPLTLVPHASNRTSGYPAGTPSRNGTVIPRRCLSKNATE